MISDLWSLPSTTWKKSNYSYYKGWVLPSFAKVIDKYLFPLSLDRSHILPQHQAGSMLCLAVLQIKQIFTEPRNVNLTITSLGEQAFPVPVPVHAGAGEEEATGWCTLAFQDKPMKASFSTRCYKIVSLKRHFLFSSLLPVIQSLLRWFYASHCLLGRTEQATDILSE